MVGKIFLFDVTKCIEFIYHLVDQSNISLASGTLALMITHLTMTKIASATAQYRSKKYATDFNEKLCTIKIGH